MDGISESCKRFLPALLLILGILVTCGCATVSAVIGDAPPILAQEELLRPYDRVSSIEVRRVRYGSPEDLTPEDYGWAHDALRAEAAKMGADAVIFPEVTVELHRYVFFPRSEMKATGTAIRFR